MLALVLSSTKKKSTVFEVLIHWRSQNKHQSHFKNTKLYSKYTRNLKNQKRKREREREREKKIDFFKLIKQNNLIMKNYGLVLGLLFVILRSSSGKLRMLFNYLPFQ